MNSAGLIWLFSTALLVLALCWTLGFRWTTKPRSCGFGRAAAGTRASAQYCESAVGCKDISVCWKGPTSHPELACGILSLRLIVSLIIGLIGKNGQEHVKESFLMTTNLKRWLLLLRISRRVEVGGFICRNYTGKRLFPRPYGVICSFSFVSDFCIRP